MHISFHRVPLWPLKFALGPKVDIRARSGQLDSRREETGLIIPVGEWVTWVGLWVTATVPPLR
jgi:hypothetical protein